MATVLVPLYVYPANNGAAWKPLLDAAERNPKTKVLVVVNPSNGPGRGQSSDYISAIQAVSSAGLPMAGYVYAEYGSRPIKEVEEDLSAWSELYPLVKHTFVDNMSTRTGLEGYFTRVSVAARSFGRKMVIGNAGAPVPRSYLGTVDAAIVYEDSGYPSSPEALDPDGWYRLRPGSFGMIAHDVSRLDVDFVTKAAAIVEYIYVTETYHAFPPYLDELFSCLGKA